MAMKKVVALMAIMAIFSTTVLAAPLSAAGSSDSLSAKTSLSSQTGETDAGLPSEEAQAVECRGKP
jgi:hypothetical protein